jgi:hypothetical protein
MRDAVACRGQGAAAPINHPERGRKKMSYAQAVYRPQGTLATWLLRLGTALEKGRRKDIRVLDDGSVELVVKYDCLGDMLAVLVELDALKAMASVDPGGAPQ